jgi:hypothetical protein
MRWREAFTEHAARLGRRSFDSPMGLGIEYADTFDAFWILPGENMSTVHLPPAGPLDVPALLSEYERLSRLRELALQVIDLHFLALGVKVERRHDGRWQWSNAQNWSGSIEVGPELTICAQAATEVAEVVASWFDRFWFGEKPNLLDIERYLAPDADPVPAEPAKELRSQAPEDPGGQTIARALVWMGLCRALQQIDRPLDPDHFAARLQPRGPIGRALLRLSQRLPGVKPASICRRPESSSCSSTMVMTLLLWKPKEASCGLRSAIAGRRAQAIAWPTNTSG